MSVREKKAQSMRLMMIILVAIIGLIIFYVLYKVLARFS
jgi:uncharacterized membrane-anchored protein